MQVYLGGMHHTSIANWKKKSCLTIFLAGCDFNCPYCSVPEFLDFKEEYLTDILDAKRQINSYAGTVETVLFTGGEPCLQRQALLNLARHCKQIGLDVGIVTNGSRSSTILSLIRENILDFIEVDIKAPFEENVFERVTKSKTFFKQTKEIIEEFQKTLDLLKTHENKIQVTFKTTVVPKMIESFEDIREIGDGIKDIKCTWLLQRFLPEVTFDKSLQELQSQKPEEITLLQEKLRKAFPDMHIETG